MTNKSVLSNPCVGVRFERLNVSLHGRSLLKDITALAPCGSATVIIGPNGAGKTTLLRCLLGEIAYTGRIDFVRTNGSSVDKPVIGYVPQQLQVDTQLPLRVYEFLALGAQNRPLWLGCSDSTRERSRRLLELVDAARLENSKLGELSGGEMRRVLLGAALGRKPELLVLDEAEAGVDYRGERLFWELLDHTRKEMGFSLLMVSHNLSLAAHYATHVICIKTAMLAQGTPKSTLSAGTLLKLFGVPIHLYPNQCEIAGPGCPDCGALGILPHEEDMEMADMQNCESANIQNVHAGISERYPPGA